MASDADGFADGDGGQISGELLQAFRHIFKFRLSAQVFDLALLDQNGCPANVVNGSTFHILQGLFLVELGGSISVDCES